MGQAIVFCGLPTQTTKNDRLRHKTRGTVLSSYFLDSALAVFLAGSGADYITGQIIAVDGGYTTTAVWPFEP